MKFKEHEKFESETQWMHDLVRTHPVLSRLPKHVQESLVVPPGDWSDLPANRRMRKAYSIIGEMVSLAACSLGPTKDSP